MKVKVTYSKLMESEIEIDDKFLALTEEGREKLRSAEEYNLEKELEEFIYWKLGSGNVEPCCVETEEEILCEF